MLSKKITLNEVTGKHIEEVTQVETQEVNWESKKATRKAYVETIAKLQEKIDEIDSDLEAWFPGKTWDNYREEEKEIVK